jgi:hypothetical protein
METKTMLANYQDNQARRDGESKSGIAKLLILTGMLGAAGLNAQSWQLSSAAAPAGSLSVPNAAGPGPYLVDDEAFHGSDLIMDGHMLIANFSANGAGGTLTTYENYTDAPYYPTVNGKTVVENCPAATVKTVYTWTFATDVAFVVENQKVNVTFAPIQQTSSCHNHAVPATMMTMIQAGGMMSSSSWDSYLVKQFAGPTNSPFRTLSVLPASGLPACNFHIQLGSDDAIDVVYPYIQVASTPQTEIASWVTTQTGFLTAINDSFDVYPNWLAGWTLYKLTFNYEGGREVPVYMAFQNSNPTSRFMLYFDPLTQKNVGWVPYN